MKRILLLFVAVICFCYANAQQHYLLKFKNVGDLQHFLQWTPERFPLLSCHRGGPMPGFPENAIETFENSTLYHPTVIECDASLTKDSALVMMHDDKLERTTNATGYVKDKTLAELGQVLLKDNDGKVTAYHIPTLDAVLVWGRDKVLFTLDVKRNVPYKMMVDAVKRNNAEKYIIMITYNADQAAEVHRLAPDLMISASVHTLADLERLNQMGVPNNRIVAFVGTSAPEKVVYDYLHSKGIWTILGTMGNLDNSAKANGDKVYTALINDGADMLSSDRSVDCGEEIKKYIAEHHLSTNHLVEK